MKENYIKALDYQDYPFDELVEELNIGWDITQNPLFDVMFVLQNEEAPDSNLGDIKMKFLPQQSKGVQCDLSLEAREMKDRLMEQMVQDGKVPLYHSSLYLPKIRTAILTMSLFGTTSGVKYHFIFNVSMISFSKYIKLQKLM